MLACLSCGFLAGRKIRLGDPDSIAQHATVSRLAMLFSAGMDIGLIFYGAAEPLSH